MKIGSSDSSPVYYSPEARCSHHGWAMGRHGLGLILGTTPRQTHARVAYDVNID